jgi:hypothetical protein
MTDYDVVCAFLGCSDARGSRLQSEVRAGRPTTDPRSGEPITGEPTVILWCEDQPVAALVGTVVLINRAAREAEHRRLVADEAARRGRDVQQVREPDLWRLAA